jgi:Mg2+/Co2+ transporter CorC
MDFVLEKEIGVLYTREQLKELLRMTGKAVDIDNDEIDIVAGALEFSLKTVEEVMTRIDDVFMVEVCRRCRVLNQVRADVLVHTEDARSGHSSTSYQLLPGEGDYAIPRRPADQ